MPEALLKSILWQYTRFDALTVHELYAMLALRNEVFVVEQTCPYQDADGKDLKSSHLLGWLDISNPAPSPVNSNSLKAQQSGGKRLIACARILPPGISYDEVSIGRVVSSPSLRGTGAGMQLMTEAMRVIREQYGDVPVRIGAQQYLERFYQKFGFQTISDMYLEDGIPHLIMLYTPQSSFPIRS